MKKYRFRSDFVGDGIEWVSDEASRHEWLDAIQAHRSRLRLIGGPKVYIYNPLDEGVVEEDLVELTPGSRLVWFPLGAERGDLELFFEAGAAAYAIRELGSRTSIREDRIEEALKARPNPQDHLRDLDLEAGEGVVE